MNEVYCKFVPLVADMAQNVSNVELTHYIIYMLTTYCKFVPLVADMAQNVSNVELTHYIIYMLTTHGMQKFANTILGYFNSHLPSPRYLVDKWHREYMYILGVQLLLSVYCGY